MNYINLINKIDENIKKTKKHSGIQIYDNRRILVETCLGILLFEENQIKLELASSFILITGIELKMNNYNNMTIEVKGMIHSINFEEK